MSCTTEVFGTCFEVIKKYMYAVAVAAVAAVVVAVVAVVAVVTVNSRALAAGLLHAVRGKPYALSGLAAGA